MLKEDFKINLQLFAEDSTEGQESTGEEAKVENQAPSFEELLKDKKYQSEFDKKVAKSLETAKSKWELEYSTKLETAKTEAEKLAKMNAEQKLQYEKEKKDKELTDREKAITKRELKAQAYETLAEKGLPKDLIEILNYESAETCQASIQAVASAFQSAVEKAVNEKLRGSELPKKNTGSSSDDLADVRRAMGLK